ncbi:MAG: arylesterase [Candidatus Latescibacterota bacterium]
MKALCARSAPMALAGVLLLAGMAASADSPERRVILFFGDSITAGYGVGREQAFPAWVQARLDSLGWDFEVVNAGLAGETAAAGLRRVDWILRRPVDVFVLELGGNDGLRGLPLGGTQAALQQILERVRARHPDAVLVVAGMQLPPNLGPQYGEEFRRLFPRLAARTGAVLVPFLLDGVGGVPGLMQVDGIHPTAEGHRRIALVVWKHLEPVLRRLSAGSLGAAHGLQGRSRLDAPAAGGADQDGEGGDGQEGQP